MLRKHRSKQNSQCLGVSFLVEGDRWRALQTCLASGATGAGWMGHGDPQLGVELPVCFFIILGQILNGGINFEQKGDPSGGHYILSFSRLMYTPERQAVQFLGKICKYLKWEKNSK